MSGRDTLRVELGTRSYDIVVGTCRSAGFEPKLERTVKTPLLALDTWKRGMYKVTNQLGGTAYEHGHIEGIAVLGKTGTAEVKKHHKEDGDRDLERWNPSAAHAWLAGWAPADDPELVIVVLVEHGGGGGQAAWPIAKQIIDGYYTKLHPMPFKDMPAVKRVPRAEAAQ